MRKYRFEVMQQVWEEATIEVEATDKEAAEAAMRAKVASGDVEWRFLESVSAEDVRITDAEVVRPARRPAADGATRSTSRRVDR